MALVSVPPTSATFLAACPKPEAFTGNPDATPPVPGMSTATIDQVLRQMSDRAAARAFSDRATLPILQWSEDMEACVIALAARRLMSQRGYNPKAGADQEIVDLAKDADDYLDSCGPSAPGGAGKRVTPQFVDSKQNQITDGIKVTSHERADWRVHDRHGAR